jgi:uncharacterized integral membrane protein
MPILSLIFTILITLGVAIFAAQNTGLITVQFIALQSVQLPLGLVMSLAVGLGVVTVAVASLLWGKRRSFSLAARQLQSRLADLEQPGKV